MSNVSGTLAATTNQVIAVGPHWLKDITFQDTSGAANLISIYDTRLTTGGSSPVGPDLPAYTGASVTADTETTSYNDQLGNAQSFTNNILRVDNAVAVSAVTSPAAKKYQTLLVPANGTVTFTPDEPAGFTNGIMIRPAGTCAYSANIGQLP